MRKTRLVILPGVRSLNKIGCLLLFLACPTIAFKGQENREVEPLCKAKDLKEFWVEESPWPGDLGDVEARNNDFGSRQRLDKLTQRTCNVDNSNRRMNGGKLESQRTLSMRSRRIVAERREVARRLDSSVDSRFRSQDNVLDSRRSVQRRNERVAESRADRFSDERRNERTTTNRAETRVVDNRERITRENANRRDLNQLDRSNKRSVERQTRSEGRDGRETRMDANVRRGLSPDRRARSEEIVRNDMQIRSQVQDREGVRDARSRSEHSGWGTRREDEVRSTRRNSESRFDTTRIRQERSTAQSHEVVRTVRERMDGGARRMDQSRSHGVRNNQRDVRREDTRRNLGETRVYQEDVRDSRLPGVARLAKSNARSFENVGRTDRRERAAARDMGVRRHENSRRETTSIERGTERMVRNRDVSQRQTDMRNTRSLQDVDRSNRRERIIENRLEESRRNSEHRKQTRSLDRELNGRTFIRTGIRNIREDIREGVRDANSPRFIRSHEEIRRIDRTVRAASDDNRVKQIENRRIGDTRRDTRDMERRANIIQDTNDVRRENKYFRDSQLLTRFNRAFQDVKRSDMRDQLLSRRGIEIRQERTTTRRGDSRVNEISAVNGRMNSYATFSRLPTSLRVLANKMESRSLRREATETNQLATRRSLSRDDVDSRKTITKRQTAEFSNDIRRSAREAEQSRQIGREFRRNGESLRESREIRMAVRTQVERSTDSARIRSDAVRSQLSGAVRVLGREERELSRRVENRREGEIRRAARSLEMLNRENGYRRVDDADVSSERIVRNAGRYIDTTVRRNDVRSVDSLRRIERSARHASYDRETKQEENRRVKEFRVDSRAMERDTSRENGRRSIEFRDSRIANSIRLLSRDSRSTEDVRRIEKTRRIYSDERESSRAASRRNDDQIRNVDLLRNNRDTMRRANDMRRSDRRAQMSENDREIRLPEYNRREVRSLERETSSKVDGLAHSRTVGLDKRSARLLRSRSVDDMRRFDRRTEADAATRETRRSEERRNSEARREMRDSVMNMNRAGKRQSEIRRTETDRNIRSTEIMDRTVQLSRDRYDRRLENVRSDRREREIRQFSIKPVDTRRMYSEDRDSRLTTARVLAKKSFSVEENRQSNQIRDVRKETRQTDSRREEGSRRDSIRLVREMKSYDESRAEVKKAFRTVEGVRRVDRLSHDNSKGTKIRRVLKTPESRTQEVRRTRSIDSRDSFKTAIYSAPTLKPDSRAERATYKWTVPAQNAEQNNEMFQKMDYYGAAKSND